MSISQKMFSRGGVNQSQDSTDDAFESTVSMWVQFSTWRSFNAPFKLSIFSEFLVQVDHEKHNLSCKLEHITWAQDKYNTSPARFLKIMIDVFRHVHIHTLPIFFLFCWVWVVVWIHKCCISWLVPFHIYPGIAVACMQRCKTEMFLNKVSKVKITSDAWKVIPII